MYDYVFFEIHAYQFGLNKHIGTNGALNYLMKKSTDDL